MDEVIGLPAHPLLVHAPVVLIPLAFVGAIAAVVLRRYRTELLVVVAGLAVVGGVTVFLAVDAGEALEDRIEHTAAFTDVVEERVEDHQSAGERVEWAAIVFVVLAVAAAGVALGLRRGGASPTVPVVPIVAVVSLIAGAVATTTVALAGHSGATAVWEDTPTSGNDGGEPSDSGGSDGHGGRDNSGPGGG